MASDVAQSIFNIMPLGEIDPERYVRLHKIIDEYLKFERNKVRDECIDLMDGCESLTVPQLKKRIAKTKEK